MIYHVVLFRLHRPEDIEATAGVLRAMEGQIPTLRVLRVGIEEKRSDRSSDIALITGFDDYEGLEAYASHPVHLKVLDHMRTVVAESRKVDWTA